MISVDTTANYTEIARLCPSDQPTQLRLGKYGFPVDENGNRWGKDLPWRKVQEKIWQLKREEECRKRLAA